jgi:hypothetical protein
LLYSNPKEIVELCSYRPFLPPLSTALDFSRKSMYTAKKKKHGVFKACRKCKNGCHAVVVVFSLLPN